MANFLTTPVPNEEAARLIESKVPVLREHFDALGPDLQGRAFTVTGVECLNTLGRVRDIVAELPRGGNWDDLKPRIVHEISPWLITATDAEERQKQIEAAERRAEMILRQNGWSAYAVVNHQAIMANKHVFPYCEYLTAEDADVRETHAALDNLIMPTDSPFWASHTPPWEFNCRCDKVPRLAEDVGEIAAEEDHKAMENRTVIQGPMLDQVESLLPLPNMGRVLDIRTPREKNGEGYEFLPDSLALSYEDVLANKTHEEATTFHNWAKSVTLEAGMTLAKALGHHASAEAESAAAEEEELAVLKPPKRKPNTLPLDEFPEE